MATTVGQHSVATFTSPVNGTTPIDANSVRGNDNTLRTSYVDHDADPGIHVQSSTLASRPVAGTAGRKWITEDSGSYTLWFDDGTNWNAVSENSTLAEVLASGNTTGSTDIVVSAGQKIRTPLVAAQDGTSAITLADSTGALTLHTALADTNLATIATAGKVSNSATTATSANTASAIVSRDASGNFTAGTVTAALSGNASTATALQTARTINGTSFDGTANITVTAAAGTLTGTTLASNVVTSSLTSVGTLANLTVTNPITGSVTGSSGSTTGNAATATALQTARTINGTSFDGTANITVTAAAGTLTGTTLNGTVVSSSLTSVGTIGTGVWQGTAISDTYLATISTAGKVSNSATTATSANTASAIVARDASGNFTAGTITATLSGAAPAGSLSGTTLASNVVSSSLTSVGTLANLTVTNPISGSVTGSSGSTTGNAATATALQTARAINGVSFNGTADITVTAAAGTLSGSTLASGVTASSLTSVGTLSSLAVTGATTLRLDGSGSTTPLILRNDSGTAPIQLVKIGFDSSGVIKSSIVAAVYGDDYMTFNVGSDTERMRLTSTGLGIGTISPSTKLDVAGNIRTSYAASAANASLIANNTSATAGGTSQLIATNDAGRGLRMQYAASGGFGVSAMTNGISTEGAQIFTDANYPLLLGTNATMRMYLDTSGNLGLGVTPSAWGSNFNALELPVGSFILANKFSGQLITGTNAYFNGTNWIYKTAATATNYEQSSGKHFWYTAPSGTAGNAITFTQAMTLDASGNLGLGVSSVGARLDVNASGTPPTASSGTVGRFVSAGGAGYDAMISVVSGNTGGASIFFGDTDSDSRGRIRYDNGLDAMLFSTAATERARITSGGYFKASDAGTYLSSTGTYHELRQSASDWTVTAGNTNATPYGYRVIHTTDANNTGSDFLYCVGSVTLRAAIRSNGGLANYQSNNVDLSDARTKKNITPAASMWNKINALEIVSYKYNDQTHDDVNLGVIAQQVETVEPVWVDTDGFGETPADGIPYKTVYTKDITFAAIKALQEAMARIETLEQRVMALEA